MPPVFPAQAVTIRLTFGGDCTLAYVNDEELDKWFPGKYEQSGSYTYPFDGIRHIFEQDDLTVVNFEGALTRTAAEDVGKKWRFRGLPEYAGILPASSVEAAGLANNHTPYDFYAQGFNDTKKYLREAGVAVFYEGSALVREIRGVQVVLVGCNAAYVDRERAARGAVREIERHKRADNVVAAFMHWGTERSYAPDEWQSRTARTLIDAGADLVVGHHSHTMQGIERYKGRYIAYSLGNLAYGGNGLARDPETFLLNVTINAGNGQPPNLGIAATPCYITSSEDRNRDGDLRNNYRPMVVTGPRADALIALLLERSALLENGIATVDIYGE